MNELKNYPKITIVTPNYNCEKYLEKTILSVINQNYPNLEYIIIDGGSNDSSVEIIKKYKNYLTYWISEPDNGMYEAIQKGFDKSTGEIMAWINSDDMYHKNSFFTVAEIFTSFSEVKWLTGVNTFYDEFDRTTYVKHSYGHNKYSMFLQPELYIQQESTFWRRELWKKAGSKLNTSLKYAGDFELWLRFNKYSQIYITDSLIAGFRYRKNQSTQLYMHIYIQESLECLKKAKNDFSFFESKIFDEIIKLKAELSFNQKKDSLEKLKYLSRENEKIKFSNKEQKFILEGNTMNNILHKITNRRNTMKDFLEFMKFELEFYPEVIFDVGAANGTNHIYEIFPESHIVLFEPVSEFLPYMEDIKSKYKHVSIETCALGSKNGTININVHPDLVGSSIYLEDEESNVNGESREVEIKTINSLIEKYNLNESSNTLLKIDVQGAEIDVLKGAEDILENIDLVILETSFFNFFNNNILIADIINYMDSKGFIIYDIFDFINRPLDGALAQVDLAFVQKKSKFKEVQVFATKEQRSELNEALNIKKKSNSIINKNDKIFLDNLNNLILKINQLKTLNYNYIIYGNGNIGKIIQALAQDKIIGYVDISDASNHPNNLKNIKFDKIIISVLGREDEIIKYLVEDLQIHRDKIITLDL